MIMLDTHIAIALFEGRNAGFSANTKRLLDRDTAFISPAVLFELEILHEIGRGRTRGVELTDYLTREFGIRIATDSFADVVAGALALAFTRDPFDRLIVAHAALLKAPLVTFDQQIRKHYPLAVI